MEWIDEAASITPERMRMLACWSYRNVLNWPMPRFSPRNLLFFGDPRVEPQPFAGLEPRH